LTKGAVIQLHENEKEDIPNLVLQVLSLKPVGSPSAKVTTTGPQRWRLMISDGIHFITAMFSTQLNHLIDEAILQRMCIVRIPNYTINMVGDRRVVVLLAVEVIDSTCTKKIGNPAACDAPVHSARPPLYQLNRPN
ncbi:replication factor-A protein 1, partial [Melampsora americana]